MKRFSTYARSSKKERGLLPSQSEVLFVDFCIDKAMADARKRALEDLATLYPRKFRSLLEAQFYQVRKLQEVVDFHPQYPWPKEVKEKKGLPKRKYVYKGI